VTPRVVVGADENHLAGYTALPLDLNPYRSSYGTSTPIVGAVLVPAGDYDVVFETAPGSAPGPFTFRFWRNDTQPPIVVVSKRLVRGALPISIRDTGSGVDPGSLQITLDGAAQSAKLRGSLVRLPVTPGRHRLRIVVSDRQEAKNMEDLGQILPNTADVSWTGIAR
jgi:hypothetical protein